MVVGYACETCGFQHECDVDKSGERICYECGNAVTGITSHDMSRFPDGGEIEFVVTISGIGRRDRRVYVTGWDYESAYEAAQSDLKDDKDYVTDISMRKSLPRL